MDFVVDSTDFVVDSTDFVADSIVVDVGSAVVDDVILVALAVAEINDEGDRYKSTKCTR